MRDRFSTAMGAVAVAAGVALASASLGAQAQTAAPKAPAAGAKPPAGRTSAKPAAKPWTPKRLPDSQPSRASQRRGWAPEQSGRALT